MKNMRFWITLVFVLLLFSSCKRFDGDALNKRLIQGNWQLMTILDKNEQKNIEIKDPPILSISEDRCLEHFQNGSSKISYKIQIKNYFINFVDSLTQKKSVYLIVRLTEDSLILDNNISVYTYIPISQENMN